MDALKLLDYDGWRLVFRKLNAEDLLTCRQVCKPFNRLLNEEEFLVKWKFHLALPILLPYLKSKGVSNAPRNNPEDDEEDEENLGDNANDASWKNLFSIRLACKSWRQSLDKYVSEKCDFKQTLFHEEMKGFPLVTRLKGLKGIEEFQEMFGETGGNPFPSRTVCIKYVPDSEQVHHQFEVELQRGREYYYEAVDRVREPYTEKVANFLEQFGRNIFKLEFSFAQTYGLNPLLLCQFLRRVTPHLANVKIFLVGNYYYFRDEERERRMAADWIRGNPLQDMPELRALQCSALQCNGSDMTVENYLLDKYAPQLIQYERNDRTALLQRVQVEKFRNLETLSLQLVDPSDTIDVLRFLESPLKLLKMTLWCPLEFERELKPFTWNVDKVLSNIKHLPVERLMISIISYLGVHRVEVEEAGLPLDEYINESIRSLSIFISASAEDNGIISFNFLQAFKNLEELEVAVSSRLEPSHPAQVPEVVKLNEYLARGRTDAIFESNLWEKVPLLKTLIVKRGRVEKRGNLQDGYEEETFTREKYEMAKARMNANV